MRDTFANEQCVRITAEETPMERAEIVKALSRLADWKLREEAPSFRLQRTFMFDSFEDGLAFLYEVGQQVATQNHHPVLKLMENQVVVTVWTPQLKGLHRNDFIIASQVSEIFERWDVISGKRDRVQEASDESFPASDPPAWS